MLEGCGRLLLNFYLVCYKVILNILSLDRTPLFTVLFDNHLFCGFISLKTILHFKMILLLSNHLVQGYDLVCIAVISIKGGLFAMGNNLYSRIEAKFQERKLKPYYEKIKHIRWLPCLSQLSMQSAIVRLPANLLQ
ncbi:MULTISPECIES: hypothetical protein [Paenibacillus]|uniref:Uncharacterized protein n=1 Tax=Paenibacillus borealis TaxID=160799 RepID=A0ABX3H7Y7_PAEBO|nr:hypothetical protein [Paenibacillus borealis]OMD45334.1 hypothetical protein BSK56_19615 [Paenibacillus borealis]